MPPPLAATGTGPAVAVDPAIAPSAGAVLTDLVPTRFAICGVCSGLPPEPGSDAARTMPEPPPAPEPPANGWLENDENGRPAAPSESALPPEPNIEVSCCSGWVSCCSCW